MYRRLVVLAPVVSALLWTAACSSSNSSPLEVVRTTSAALTTTSVLTQGGGNQRTNSFADPSPTPSLTTRSVGTGGFGFKWRRQVRGSICAQPLVVSNVTLAGTLCLSPPCGKNIVIVATMQNRVYAFDADDLSADAPPLWTINLARQGGSGKPPSAPPATLPDPNIGTGPSYTNIRVSIGIEGTPVVGPDSSGNLYLYAVVHSHTGYDYMTRAGGVHTYVLYKIDVTSGFVAGFQTIEANVSNSSGGQVAFDARFENQRAGLLLETGTSGPDDAGAPQSGTVYFAFSSYNDSGNWYGWVLAYDSTTLAQQAAFNVAPNGGRGGIWQSGAGLATINNSVTPEVFLTTGNSNSRGGPPNDLGVSVVHLNMVADNTALEAVDSFTPRDANFLNGDADLDFSAGGTMILSANSSSTVPDLVVAGGKTGILYLLNANKLGGENTSDTGALAIAPQDPCVCSGFNCDSTMCEEIHSIVGWDLPGAPVVYVWPETKDLQRITVGLPAPGKTAPYSLSSESPNNVQYPTYANLDPMMSLSTYTDPSTGTPKGVLWASIPIGGDGDTTAHGELRAFDATSLVQLWDSQTTVSATNLSAKDDVGIFSKFLPPTIANGSVYLGNLEGVDPGNTKLGSITTGFTAFGSPALISAGDDYLTLTFTGQDGHIYVTTTPDGLTYTRATQLPDTSFWGPTTIVAKQLHLEMESAEACDLG